HSGPIRIPRRFCAFERWNDLGEIMSVNFQAAPTQALENASQVYRRPWITAIAAMLFVNCKNPTELLQPIPIENSSKVSQLVARRDVECFPDHPLLKLSVSHYNECMKLFAP